MANDLTNLPYILDTAGTTLLLNRNQYVRQVRWVGTDATVMGQTAELKDKQDKVVWSAIASGANHQQTDRIEAEFNGIKLTTLGSGKVYVYIRSVILFLALLAFASPALAQTHKTGTAIPTGAVPVGGSDGTNFQMMKTTPTGEVVTSGGSPSTASCKKWRPLTRVTVDATVGGVQVAAASTTRCELLLQNVGAADMNCSTSGGGAPTTTFGVLLVPDAAVRFGLEAQESVNCLRVTATSTTASPVEAIP